MFGYGNVEWQAKLWVLCSNHSGITKNDAYIVQIKKNCAPDFMIVIGKANADEGLLSVTSASFKNSRESLGVAIINLSRIRLYWSRHPRILKRLL